MACIPKEAVSRMTRLIGDADKAECKVNKLRSITSKLDEREIEVEAEIFKALADPCRLKILSLLREGELCVCEIMVGVDRPHSRMQGSSKNARTEDGPDTGCPKAL